MMWDLIHSFSTETAAIMAALAGIGLLLRKGWRKVKHGLRRANSLVDTLVGRGEIRHPDTGEVLVSAQPGLDGRLSGMESALSRLAETSDTVAKVEIRMDVLEARFDVHEAAHTPSAQSVVVEVSTPPA